MSSSSVFLSIILVISVLLLQTSAADEAPPTLPLQFSARVILNQSDGVQLFEWFFDRPGMREARVWSYPTKITSVLIYHNNSVGCDDNSCCTISTWQQANPKATCTASNTSNVQDPSLWSWLTDDEFTHQRATFLRTDHDTNPPCNLWQHNSRPIYPKSMNETACVAQSRNESLSLNLYVPVYSNWTDNQGTYEHQIFSDFKSGADFPPGIFDSPKGCVAGPSALVTHGASDEQ